MQIHNEKTKMSKFTNTVPESESGSELESELKSKLKSDSDSE